MSLMKKNHMAGLLFVAASFLSGTLHATLINGSTLSFTAAPGGFSITTPSGGSWFGIEPASYGYQPISSFQGVIVGSTQPASGSHSGIPDGSESPGIDTPHNWFSNTGMFGSASPITIISASGNTATLDFSGLTWSWAGTDNVVINEASLGDTGIASVTCAVNCGNGDTYTLDFLGHIPLGSPFGFGGELVALHLEGSISAAPVPGTAWLFGSGVMLLMGAAKRCTHRTRERAI